MQVDRSGKPTNTQRILRSNRTAEHRLVKDAMQKLGMTAPVAADAKRAQEVGYIAVPIGTEVYREGQNDPEVVVGTHGNQLITGRVNPDTGAIEFHAAPFDSYAKYSQSLLSSPATMDGYTAAQLVQFRKGEHTAKGFADQLWAPLDDSVDDPMGQGEVSGFGDQATVTLQHVNAPAGTEPAQTQVPWKFWRSNVRQSEALTPVATLPTSAEHVANLRWLVGDKHVIVSAAGQYNKLPFFDQPEDQQPAAAARDRVIGTETLPGLRGKPVLDRIDSIQKFYHDYVGSDVMPSWRQMLGTTDIPEDLANASAGNLIRGRAQLNEGPRENATTQEWLSKLPSDTRRQYTHINKLLRTFDVGVFGHEGDHIDQIDNWGDYDETMGKAAQTPIGKFRSLQQGLSMESFSDIGGDARSGTPDVGVRQLARLNHYYPNLQSLYNLDVRIGPENWDPHMGTQLLTLPMAAFGLDHGSAELAEVLGAATRQIGTDLKEGRYTNVDLPHAASALHEAAARRLGINDPSVKALRAGWAKVGVPLRDVNYGSWGEAASRVHGGDEALQNAKVAEEMGVRDSLDTLDRVSSMKRPNSAAISQVTRVRNSDAGRSALLTSPVAKLGRQHGWGAVNTITKDARMTLGSQLREGRFDTVSVPDAARALHEATQRHFGTYSAPAEHVAAGYRALFTAEQLGHMIHG